MSNSLSAETLLDRLAGLQHRAHTLHGDASDRQIRSELRDLSIRVARISATLSGMPDVDARMAASEMAEAEAIVLVGSRPKPIARDPDGR